MPHATHQHHHRHAKQAHRLADRGTHTQELPVGLGEPVRFGHTDDSNDDGSSNGHSQGSDSHDTVDGWRRPATTVAVAHTSPTQVDSGPATRAKPSASESLHHTLSGAQLNAATHAPATSSRSTAQSTPHLSKQVLAGSSTTAIDEATTGTRRVTAAHTIAPTSSDSTPVVLGLDPSASSGSSGGLSGGATAGIAIGAVAGAAIIAAVITWLVLRQKHRRPRAHGSTELIDNEKSAPDEPAPEPPRHDRHPELQLDLPSPVSLHHQELPAEPPRLAEVKRGSQFAPFQGRASITPFIDDDVAEEEPVTKPSDIVDRSGLSPTSPDRQSRALTAITASPRDSLTGDSQNPFDHPEHVVAAAASPNAVLDDPIPSPLNDPTLVPLAKEAGISILSEKLFKPSASVSSAGFATQKDHSDSESHNWSIIQSNEANSELSTTPTTSAFPQSLAYSNSPGLSPINSTDATSQPQPAQAPVTGAVAKANVYRVLIDFEPQMDDELPLRRGRLVRLLHSYDDGWALCCLLDNSAQGVAPRTCLAPIPFKPRSRPNPRNTGASKQHTSAPPSPLKETWTESVPIPVNPTASPAASHPTMPATLAPTKYEAWPLSAQEAPSATGAQPGANRSHPSLRETDVAPARPSPTYSTMPKVTTPQHLRPSSVSRTSLVSEAPEGARSSRVSTQSFVTANESSTDLTAAR